MKIILTLPTFEAALDDDGYTTATSGVCAGCGDDRYGYMARLHPVGWLHAENEDGELTCLQKAVNSLVTSDASAAWVSVAQHVAKYPSRHDAATIRSVLRELANLVTAGGNR
ncbi:hypothetical protein [Streptomyces drozdowiczii]|uniref:hypothetical protein n=1 Tax=Streptomyces drozdowiczii TaxID=202862 RepID=UPI00403D1E9C